MKTIAFFNNKGGVGKTSLVYHLAWMFADQGVPVLAIDLDPQANLTSMFLDEDQLESLWETDSKKTISDSLRPLEMREGDIADPYVQEIRNNLGLVPGNLALSKFEDLLSVNWGQCLSGDVGAFRVVTAFHRIIVKAAKKSGAEVVLIDVSPNLGAINRSALIAAQYVVLPLAPDLFSLQGLKNLGPTLRDQWRKGWNKRLEELPKDANIDTPEGKMEPVGYVVMQHGIKDSRPVKAYQRWMERIPSVYREFVLDETLPEAPKIEDDPYKLALLKHYRSLMPMAMEARKPIFTLTPADGAIGAHTEAVKACYTDFLSLAKKIASNTGINLKRR
jgi:chromosome partitioning protein